MKNLPSSSTTSVVSGIWFVHREPEVILRVWLSTLNGKEKVYANDEVITEKRNITRLTTLHQFDYQGSAFDLEIYASNLMLMELECNFFREGKLVSAQVNKYLPNGNYEIRDNQDHQVIIQRALERFKQSGIKELNQYDLPAARSYFNKTLTILPDHAETYFLLACIDSLEEQKADAFSKLEKAIELDLTGRDRILKEDKLAYLRIQPEFEAFRDRHFGISE